MARHTFETLFIGFWILLFVVGFSSIRGDYSSIRGDYSSVTPASKIIYRTAWGASVFFYLLTLFILSPPFLLKAHDADHDSARALFVLLALVHWPFAAVLLWLGAVRRLEINVPNRTYCLTRTWLPGLQWRKRGTLDDFTGVCRNSNGRVLVALRRREGMFYAYPISLRLSSLAAEQMAEQMARELTLPVVPIPRGMAR